MMRVLITGAGSYIGTHIAAWLARFPERFDVREADVRGEWNRDALAGCDAVIHVAGLAHQRETEENRPLYDRVNRALAVEVAGEAKARGVKQFVFFSSMSVYGLSRGHITADTPPAPVSGYGISKWRAEQELAALADGKFCVAVLRPPMVYGRGCRGNYPRLSALARSVAVFPRVENERSMLHIDVLCGFVQRLLESGEGGLYFPQNREYVCTCDMMREIARCHGRRLRLVPGFGWLVSLLARRVTALDKAFGSLTYDQAMSAAFADEPQPSFAETIRLTEEGKL